MYFSPRILLGMVLSRREAISCACLCQAHLKNFIRLAKLKHVIRLTKLKHFATRCSLFSPHSATRNLQTGSSFCQWFSEFWQQAGLLICSWLSMLRSSHVWRFAAGALTKSYSVFIQSVVWQALGQQTLIVASRVLWSSLVEYMENCCRSNYLKPSTLRPPSAIFF